MQFIEAIKTLQNWSLGFSKIRQLWNHEVCAASCCTNGSSSQASANARMYFRLRGESPST